MVPLIVIIAGIVAVSAAPAEFYESRYDHLDVENILNNRRMVNYYAGCLLSKGPCPPQGVEFKRILPEALRTNCARCTEKQKTITYRTIKRLKKEYPKIWDQLQMAWDPDDIYVRKFEANFQTQKPSVVATSPPIVSSSPPILSNRFADNEEPEAANNVVSSTPFSSTSTTTTTGTTITTSTKPTTKTTKTITTTKLTNKPIFITKPQQAPPFTTVGANLQATVSFGTNLVGGIVRSLGTLGTRVVESGTKLANMVISAALRT